MPAARLLRLRRSDVPLSPEDDVGEREETGKLPEFDTREGLALALAYLEDPSNVPCPRCGPGAMEVVAYLEAKSMERGEAVPTVPEGDYTVVLYCHECSRAAALDLSRDADEEDYEEEKGLADPEDLAA